MGAGILLEKSCLVWREHVRVSPQRQPLLHLPEKTCVELVQWLKCGKDAFLQRVWSLLLLSHSILERLRAESRFRLRGNALKIPSSPCDVALPTLWLCKYTFKLGDEIQKNAESFVMLLLCKLKSTVVCAVFGRNPQIRALFHQRRKRTSARKSTSCCSDAHFK